MTVEQPQPCWLRFPGCVARTMPVDRVIRKVADKHFDFVAILGSQSHRVLLRKDGEVLLVQFPPLLVLSNIPLRTRPTIVMVARDQMRDTVDSPEEFEGLFAITHRCVTDKIELIFGSDSLIPIPGEYFCH